MGLDFNKLANMVTGSITLLREDRITVKHGVTEIDLFSLETFDPIAETMIDSAISYEEAHGWAWYRDSCYAPMCLVTQEMAEDLVKGGSFPAHVTPERKLKELLNG